MLTREELSDIFKYSKRYVSDAIKDTYYNVLDFTIVPWYHNVILRERCRNCRCWRFMGRHIQDGQSKGYGVCLWDIRRQTWFQTSENNWCECYNVLPEKDATYTELPDGHEDFFVTPAGKEVTRISKNGRWLYLHDGRPYWWD